MANRFLCRPHQSSLVSDLLAHVDKMNDVELVSNDGHVVGANKYILGARSPVLRRALFDTNKLKLNFSKFVVETMVEYCRSNELTKLASNLSTLAENPRELVHISQIAHVLQLPGLANQTLALTEALLKQHCHLACALLDEAGDNSEESQMGDITKLALHTIADNPREALLYQKHKVLPLSVLQLSGKTLLQLCQKPDLNCTESFLFHVLVKWFEFHGEEQRAAVAQCVKNLDLYYMKPSFLVGTVAPSGLVPQTKIDVAFQQIALDTETGVGPNNEQLFSQTRKERFVQQKAKTATLKQRASEQSRRILEAALPKGVTREPPTNNNEGATTTTTTMGSERTAAGPTGGPERPFASTEVIPELTAKGTTVIRTPPRTIPSPPVMERHYQVPSPSRPVTEQEHHAPHQGFEEKFQARNPMDDFYAVMQSSQSRRNFPYRDDHVARDFSSAKSSVGTDFFRDNRDFSSARSAISSPPDMMEQHAYRLVDDFFANQDNESQNPFHQNFRTTATDGFYMDDPDSPSRPPSRPPSQLDVPERWRPARTPSIASEASILSANSLQFPDDEGFPKVQVTTTSQRNPPSSEAKKDKQTKKKSRKIKFKDEEEEEEESDSSDEKRTTRTAKRSTRTKQESTRVKGNLLRMVELLDSLCGGQPSQ